MGSSCGSRRTWTRWPATVARTRVGGQPDTGGDHGGPLSGVLAVDRPELDLATADEGAGPVGEVGAKGSSGWSTTWAVDAPGCARVMTTEEAAAHLKLSIRTLERLRTAGEGPPGARIGQQWRPGRQ
jgi:hypothetical protein